VRQDATTFLTWQVRQNAITEMSQVEMSQGEGAADLHLPNMAGAPGRDH
jgi:hypothetical protein